MRAHSHVVGMFIVGNGSCLHQVLINADQTNHITTGNIIDCQTVFTHHDNSSVEQELA